MLRPHQDSLVVRRGVQTVQENLWAACVGNWTAWQGTPGVANEIPSAEIFGTAVDGTTRLEDLSRTDGRAHLRVSIDASGPGATPLVTELLMDHAPLADPSTLDVSEVSFRSVREVVIDPTNLRPDRASYVVEMHATIGGTPRTRTEGHDLRFDWANATGCGR